MPLLRDALPEGCTGLYSLGTRNWRLLDGTGGRKEDMSPEIVAAAILTGAGSPLLLYGVKLATHHEINLSQFIPGKYQVTMAEVKKKSKTQQLPTARTLLLVLAGGLTAGLVVYTVIGILWVALGASLLGLLMPRLWSNWHKAGQNKLRFSQIEQAMETMSAVLRSGDGITSALERAAREIGSPLSAELIQTAGEIKVGKSPAEAFERLANRVQLPEMTMLHLAVSLQQTGMAINMAAVFEEIQSGIRNRQALAEEVSALTAQNRMSAWIVGAVPFGFIGMVRWIAPDFIAPLFETPLGLTVFVVSTAAIITGIIWITRMASSDNF
ncbi:MAG: type II secretion system F family protein [Bacillota bacterium]